MSADPDGAVRPAYNGGYWVAGRTGHYYVDPKTLECGCPDFRFRRLHGEQCRHITALLPFLWQRKELT